MSTRANDLLVRIAGWGEQHGGSKDNPVPHLGLSLEEAQDIVRAIVEELGLRDTMIEALNRAVMYIRSEDLDDLTIAIATILEAAGQGET